MKQTIYQNLCDSNGNTFSFIPHVLFFILRLDCCFRRSEFNNTRTLTYLSYSIKVPSLPPPLCKNHKKPEVDNKIQVCETFILTESFVFSQCRCSRQSVSRLLTLNLSEHFIRWGFFQICSGNNNTSLLLYACKVIHLIKKRVTSPYVQE